jgi:hypothetical protein
MTPTTLSRRDAAILEARRVLARKPIVIEIMPSSFVGAAEVCAVAGINWRGEVLFDDVIRPTVSIGDDVTAMFGKHIWSVWDPPTFRDVWEGYLRSVLKGERTGSFQPICIWYWTPAAVALAQSLKVYDLRAGYIKPPLEIAALVGPVMPDTDVSHYWALGRCVHGLRLMEAVAQMEIEHEP